MSMYFIALKRYGLTRNSEMKLITGVRDRKMGVKIMLLVVFLV